MCPFAICFICLHFGLPDYETYRGFFFCVLFDEETLFHNSFSVQIYHFIRFMLEDSRYGSWFQICAPNFVFTEFKCIDGVSCTDVTKPSFYLCFFPNWIWKKNIRMFPRVFPLVLEQPKA